MDKKMRDLLNQKPTSHPFSDDEIIGLTRSYNQYTKGVIMGSIVALITALVFIFMPEQEESIDHSQTNPNSQQIEVALNNEEIPEKKKSIAPSDDSVNIQSKTGKISSTILSTTNQNISSKTEVFVLRRMPYKDEDMDSEIHSKWTKVYSTRSFADSSIPEQSKIRTDESFVDNKSDSIHIQGYGRGGWGQLYLPLLTISLEELNRIVPGSFENEQFNIFFDYITSKRELDSLRPNFNLVESTDEKFIQRFKYPNSIFHLDSTRFNIGLPVDNGTRDLADLDKALYLSYSEHIDATEDWTEYSYQSPIISPMISLLNLVPDYDSLKTAASKLERVWYTLRTPDAAENYLNLSDSIQTMEFELKSQLIPVKVTPFRDYYIVLWFYPTEEFISKLPERYKTDVADQFEIYKEINNGEGSLGMECVKIEGKKDYFGLCGQRRGAIEKVKIPTAEEGSIITELTLTDSRLVKIYISTISGQLVYEEQHELGSQTNFLNIHNESIKPGAYFLVVETDQGELAIEKVFVRASR